jgi:lysophospholipase L1-like esterase
MSKRNAFRFFTVFQILLLVLLAAGFSGSFFRARAAAIKIMPLGDSITGNPGCWRAILWNRLQSSGFTNIDFVGTLNNMNDCGVAFDGDNEGHGGFLATNIASQNQLPPWLAATNPDVVMIQLGTNDVWNNIAPATILAAFSTLIDQARANNPNVRVIVAQITPLNPTGCADCPQRVINFNAAIPAWASAKSTSQSPVTVVDLWTGFDTATDTADGVHPNATTGFQKVANSWYPAISGLLSGVPTNTPTITPGGPTLTPSHTPTKTLTPTPTNTPVPHLQINMQSASVDTNAQTSVNLQIVNTGTGSSSNISWRWYFTPENGNAASTYFLEKYYDQSSVATVSGPTLACNNIYYFTVSYGATALASGATWAYNTAFHLSSFASTYDSLNDFWRNGYASGALPAAFTANPSLPAYVGGSRIWGNEPNCGGVTVTNTPTPVITNTLTRTPTQTSPPVTSTPTSTLGVSPTRTPTATATCPCFTNTPTVTLGASPTLTRTPTIMTGTPAITNTPTRTFTPTTPPVITNTPTRTFTPTSGPSPTGTMTVTVTPTTGGACTPVTSVITVPFVFDGPGTFCWQASALGSFINSWNNNSVTLNGVNVTNIWVGSGSYPAKIGGFYYINYNGGAFGHFETKP